MKTDADRKWTMHESEPESKRSPLCMLKQFYVQKETIMEDENVDDAECPENPMRCC